MGRSARFKMTSTCGHVMGVDFPARYNNWDRVDPMELFNCPTEKKEANPKLKMPAVSLGDLFECMGCHLMKEKMCKKRLLGSLSFISASYGVMKFR